MRLVGKVIETHSSFKWGYIANGVIMLILSGITNSVQVPDTKGMKFLFSTPLCSDEYPEQMHIIPQTTEAVNVTLEALEYNAQFTRSEHTIKADDSLHMQLPCIHFVWEMAKTAGLLLETTSEVTIYIDNKDDNYILFPVDALGYEYIVTSVTTIRLPESFFVVHGNNSLVELTLPMGIQSHISISGKQYQGGSTINITVPTNGVIGLKCSCDLTGATVKSALPISVLVGSMETNSTNAVLEQLPAKDTWGRKFIFANSNWFAQNVTIKITGEELSAAVTITTKNTSQKKTFQRVIILSMQLDFSDFLSVETNISVSCVIMYQLIDEQNARHMALSFLTPIELYHISSSFAFDTVDAFTCNLILSSSIFQYVSLNKTTSRPFDKAMTYWWNYFICSDIPLSRPQLIKTNAKNTVPYYGTVLRRNNNTAYEYSLGMRITNLYGACVKTLRPNGGNGDGIDNDCDSKIDEEKLNKVDDDNDGLIDEDVLYAGKIVQRQSETAWEYHMTHKEKEGKFSASVVSIVIPLSAALTLVVLFIGGMLIADKLRRSSSTNRVSPLYFVSVSSTFTVSTDAFSTYESLPRGTWRVPGLR